MNQDKLLILCVVFFTIGFSFIEAYGRHVCQYNVKVPYTRRVTKTELIPFEEDTYSYGKETRPEVTSVVEEMAYKYEMQPKCCPGYEGPIENCMRTSTTPKDIISSTSVSPLGVSSSSESITESSTLIVDVMEFTNSDHTDEVPHIPIDFFETTSTEMSIVSEAIATKVNWLSLLLWFFCILVILAFLGLVVKMLIHRNARRSYVVTEKVMSTESHC